MGGLFVFLGTGASAGIPVIGCECKICASSDRKNRRLRPSGWLQVGGKSFLIDSGPDFREQALTRGIRRIDGLLLTHMHFDHIGGLDDLRIFCIRQEHPVPCLLSSESFQEMQLRYHYMFKQGKILTARFDCHLLEEEEGTMVFEGVPIRYVHYRQGDMKITGYRIGDFAYISDIRDYDPSIFDSLKGVSHLVLSALHPGPSHNHFSVEDAIEFSAKVGAKQTWLTHLCHLVDHEEVNSGLPAGVELAYDGLSIEFGE